MTSQLSERELIASIHELLPIEFHKMNTVHLIFLAANNGDTDLLEHWVETYAPLFTDNQALLQIYTLCYLRAARIQNPEFIKEISKVITDCSEVGFKEIVSEFDENIDKLLDIVTAPMRFNNIIRFPTERIK